jgi:hypothetical protein
MTDSPSAIQPWDKAPILGLRPDLYYCQTVGDLLIWGALCDERTRLLFTISAGPRERRRDSSQSHIATDGHSVSLGVEQQIFITLSTVTVCFCGVLSLTRRRVCLFICCWPSPAQSFSGPGPGPLVLATIFYCLRFPFSSPPTTRRVSGTIRPCLHTTSNSQLSTVVLSVVTGILCSATCYLVATR